MASAGGKQVGSGRVGTATTSVGTTPGLWPSRHQFALATIGIRRGLFLSVQLLRDEDSFVFKSQAVESPPQPHIGRR